MTTASIVDVLGGPSVLKESSSSIDALRDRVRAGLPFDSLETVMRRFGIRREEVSAALDLPLRTFSRRKRERRLSADESDRLYRLARIAARASEVLGDEDKASSWLHRPNRALAGESPVSLLDTDLGARQVEDVLGRIEYGVYS